MEPPCTGLVPGLQAWSKCSWLRRLLIASPSRRRPQCKVADVVLLSFRLNKVVKHRYNQGVAAGMTAGLAAGRPRTYRRACSPAGRL